MRENFDTIHAWVLANEGGYVDHPRDPGGATNLGITQRVYDGWRRGRGAEARSVCLITRAEARDIYRTQYWDKVWGDRLPAGLDYCVYDFAVHSGPRRAVLFLQQELGCRKDGVLGNETFGAVMACADVRGVIVRLCYARLNWLKMLSTWKVFGRGFKNRIMGDKGFAGSNRRGVLPRSLDLFDGDTRFQQEDNNEPTGKGDEGDTRPVERIREGLTFENIGKIVGGAVGPALLAAAQQEGPLQYALAAAVVLAAGLAAFAAWKILFRKGSNHLA